MAKIKDESNAKDDAALPRRENTKTRDARPGGFGVGNGGQRVRADGVTVNGDGHPNGWQTGGRDENG